LLYKCNCVNNVHIFHVNCCMMCKNGVAYNEDFTKRRKFCYSWRSYQAELLSNLEDHLYNKHLHLVAPPGSGKTVLGLEVMRRLNKATLIVAPTLAIRNQ